MTKMLGRKFIREYSHSQGGHGKYSTSHGIPYTPI